MPLSLVVVCEARADFETASVLADRLICESIDWIEPDSLDYHRRYDGHDSDRPFLTWARLEELAKEASIRPRGFIEGQPADLDAAQAQRALIYIKAKLPATEAVLLVRDDDREKVRRRGLEQARAASSMRECIIIGLAHTKRECWVLAGFEARNDQERDLLAEVREELGFDPCTRAEELTAKHDHDKRSAKGVLKRLVQSNHEREASCWKHTPLQLLRDRGESTGLRDYLDEIQKRLVPLLGPSYRPRS
jgi:hypothetical protein